MVFEKIKTVIIEQLGVAEEKITLETSLLNDIGADSLDIFQVISNLEEEFGIEFSSEVVADMKTVGDAVKYIEENTGK